MEEKTHSFRPKTSQIEKSNSSGPFFFVQGDKKNGQFSFSRPSGKRKRAGKLLSFPFFLRRGKRTLIRDISQVDKERETGKVHLLPLGDYLRGKKCPSIYPLLVLRSVAVQVVISDSFLSFLVMQRAFSSIVWKARMTLLKASGGNLNLY